MMKTVPLLLCALVAVSIVYGSDPQPEPAPEGWPEPHHHNEHLREDWKFYSHHQQILNSLYHLEYKAAILSKRECIIGEEYFEICSLKLNVLEFFLCLCDSRNNEWLRSVHYPPHKFPRRPALAVAIKGIGQLAFSTVKVTAEDTTKDGFTIKVKGEYPGNPYSVTVQWIACPRRNPLNPSIEDGDKKPVAQNGVASESAGGNEGGEPDGGNGEAGQDNDFEYI